MRAWTLPILLLLAGCAEGRPATAAQSWCREQAFEGTRFTICDSAGGRLELVAAARNEAPIRRLADLDTRLGKRARDVAFAMNAGMYGEDGRPIGLAIVEGKQVRAINRRQGGGNFHLMPNGVFQVRRSGRACSLCWRGWEMS